MVAGSSAHKNPIITSFLQKKQHCIDLDPGSIRETEVNEPLINWHSFDGDHGLRALYETNGWARDVSDRSMLRLAKILKEKEGLNVLPAATAGLAALAQPPNPELLQNDRFVVVLTSRK